MTTLLAQIDFDALQNSIPNLDSTFKWNPGATAASKVGLIITRIIPFLFVIAGLMLLFYLIYGGFHMMTAANDEKGLTEAKAKITNALVGFVILFVAFWLVKILDYILGGGFF